MIYINNEHITKEEYDKYCLKYLSRDSYISDDNSYYNFVFDILSKTDSIIDELFNTYTFSIAWTEEKSLGNIISVAINVINRLQREHHIETDIRINYVGNGDVNTIIYQISKNIKGPEYYRYIQENPEYKDRQTGRTTRQANMIIQMSFDNWKNKINNKIDIIDHCSYEFLRRGSNVYGNNQFNRHLMQKIKDRLWFELPDDIHKYIKISNKCDIIFEFPYSDKIDYTQIE